MEWHDDGWRGLGRFCVPHMVWILSLHGPGHLISPTQKASIIGDVLNRPHWVISSKTDYFHTFTLSFLLGAGEPSCTVALRWDGTVYPALCELCGLIAIAAPLLGETT